ncbi:MAG: helix-turn-helix domain-containing protein [Oligoflexia bacterium]|nr:helix-turn-helix domain-containing protein [Oligoflexia bacterium]
MNEQRKIFSKNLKRLRKKKNFTQELLAERLGINTRYVQRLEGSKCPNVKIDTMATLAHVLNVKIYDFFRD